MGNGAVADDIDEGPGSSKAKWVVVFLAIIGLGLFIGYVLYNDEIRRDLFWQRATMLAMIVFIVVVFFAGLTSRAQLSIPALSDKIPAGTQGMTITIVGAGALLYFLLGPITNVMFPQD